MLIIGARPVLLVPEYKCWQMPHSDWHRDGRHKISLTLAKSIPLLAVFKKTLLHQFVKRADIAKCPAFCTLHEVFVIFDCQYGFAIGITTISCPRFRLAGGDQQHHKRQVIGFHDFGLGLITCD